jgi:hypothetical protein
MEYIIKSRLKLICINATMKFKKKLVYVRLLRFFLEFVVL